MYCSYVEGDSNLAITLECSARLQTLCMASMCTQLYLKMQNGNKNGIHPLKGGTWILSNYFSSLILFLGLSSV